MKRRSPNGTAGPRRKLWLYAFFLGLVVTIAALQLIIAPSLVSALVAPDLGKYLSNPLSGPTMAQIHFIPSIAVINLALIIYALHGPMADLRLRLLVLTFIAVTFVLLSVLILDRNDITAEESRLTHFNGAMLFIAALFAAFNAGLARDTFRTTLWGVASAAMAFGAFDEILEIHEKIGNALRTSVGGTAKAAGQPDVLPFQDFVTLIYSVSGLLVLAALYLLFRKKVKGSIYSIYCFLAAVVVYFISTILDAFDFLLAPMSSTVDILYLASVLEEVLEFMAASLFFVGFATALLEGGGRRRLDHIQSTFGPRFVLPAPALWAARLVTYIAAATFAAGLVALPLRYPARSDIIAENSQYSLRLFAHSSENHLLHPDGMVYANGQLYVANDIPPSIMAMKPGKARMLASADDLGRPETIEVARDGTVYVTDDSRRLLLRLRQGLEPETVLGATELIEPKGLAFDPKGALHIVDFGASRILVLRGNKAQVYAAVPGHKPEEIAFDRYGNLYFTEERPARVTKITPSGQLSTFADESSGLSAVEDIAVRGDDIYLADSRRGAIFKFGPNGQGKVILAFEKRTGAQIEAMTLGEQGVFYVGFRQPERSSLGLRRVDFIMCIADPKRVKAACGVARSGTGTRSALMAQ